MKETIFQQYSTYYDLLYRDKDYAAEASYIARTIRAAAPEARQVLEFGSGTGRHGRLLASNGFDVLGVERSESMPTAGREKSADYTANAREFNCIRGDARTIDLKRRFDAVLSLFHVVGYQVSNADARQIFMNAARHLESGGIFFFDVWHGPAVLTQRPTVRVKRVEDETTQLTRLAEPELNTNASAVNVHYTIMAVSKKDGLLKTFQEEHLVRYFFASEVDLLAGEAGFEVERSEEFLTGKMPSEDTWSVAYLLRKRSSLQR